MKVYGSFETPIMQMTGCGIDININIIKKMMYWSYLIEKTKI